MQSMPNSTMNTFLNFFRRVKATKKRKCISELLNRRVLQQKCASVFSSDKPVLDVLALLEISGLKKTEWITRKMKLSNLIRLIAEELEVVLTNEEAGELFGEDVQRQLEEDEAAEEQGGFFSDSAEEEAAEGEQAMPDAIASLAEDKEAEAREEEEKEDEIEALRDEIKSLPPGDEKNKKT